MRYKKDNNVTKKKKMKELSGITLIALVIT